MSPPRSQGSEFPAWRWWAIGFGLWTLLAILGAAQLHFYQNYSEKSIVITWAFAFRQAFQEWYVMGALSIAIIGLAKRYPIEREHLRGRLLLHAGASVFISLVYTTCLAALMHGQTSHDGTIFNFARVWKKATIFYTHEHVILYWLVLLVHHGWHYSRRAREREVHAAELQTQLAQARLMALRMQLNPHFLFNTLNTISALIHERPEDADRMVVRLSELLRLSLADSGAPEVALSRELALLERYLEVEKIRFEERLEVRFQIDPETRDVAVPSLILQPIVENAIRHGIETRETGGRVEIRARRDSDRLELTVTDNGPGLPEAVRSGREEGIGLANTRARLRQLYGDRQRLELLASADGGARVRLLLPWAPGPVTAEAGSADTAVRPTVTPALLRP